MAAEKGFMVAQLLTPHRLLVHRLLVRRCRPAVFHRLGPGRCATSAVG
jgi:hypothetical protein